MLRSGCQAFRKAWCLIVVLAGAGCSVPQPMPCRVMTLGESESFKVLSRYGRSYLDIDCDQPVPKEILISGNGYEVYLLLRANEPAQAFIGVRPHRSPRYALSGAGFKEDDPGSYFRDQATHNFRLPWLVDNKLVFQVLDRDTGKTYAHSFNVGSVPCTCKTYDGL